MLELEWLPLAVLRLERGVLELEDVLPRARLPPALAVLGLEHEGLPREELRHELEVPLELESLPRVLLPLELARPLPELAVRLRLEIEVPRAHEEALPLEALPLELAGPLRKRKVRQREILPRELEVLELEDARQRE